MNIFFISNLYPAYPGQKRSEMTYALHDFTSEWAKLGHNVKVLALWDIYPRIFNFFSDFARKKRNYAMEEEFTLDNVSITRTPVSKIPHFPYSSKAVKKSSEKISENLKKTNFKPDIIVVHGLYPAQIGLAIKEKLKIPMVTGIHTTDRFRIEKQGFPKIINKVLDASDGLTFRSNTIKKNIEKAIPEITKEKETFVALSGIEQSLILSEEEFENKIKKKNKVKKFITVCNLIPRKNIDLLIKAFVNLNNNDSELIIIGNGPEREKLERLVIDLNIDDKVIFYGEQTRSFVIEQLKKSDFFVMVSHSETFGLVYLEAMASGCIPVGTKGEGIDGVIQDGYNGFLCNPNVQELTQKLKYLISIDDHIKAEFLKNAIETAKKYSTESKAKDYLDFIYRYVTTI